MPVFRKPFTQLLRAGPVSEVAPDASIGSQHDFVPMSENG
jgi:hypothetical protein